MEVKYNYSEINKIDIKTILTHYGIELINNKQLRCINHNHIDNNPSAFIGDNNKVNCKVCDTSYNVLETIKILSNIDDLNEASKIAFEITGNTYSDYNNSFATLKETNTKNTKDNQNNRYNATFNYCFSDVGIKYQSQREKVVESYLNERGITNISYLKEILTQNKIYYSLDKYNQIIFFFTRENIGIYRRDNSNQFLGKYGLTKVYSDKNSNYLFITEGIFDMLSLVEEGQNTICLNSVQNINLLIDYLKTNIDKIKKNNIKIILCLDNDRAGIEAENKLIQALEKECDFYEWDFYLEHKRRNIKDINDLKIQLSKENKKLIDFYDFF